MVRKHTAALLVGLTGLAVVLTGAMAVVGADSPEEPSADQQIAVEAMGSAEAEPDKAILDVAVRVEGEDPETLRSELASGGSTLQSALDEENVEYRTTGYTLEQPHRERKETPEYIGYHALEVVVDNPDNVGAIVDVVAEAGGTVESIDMTLAEETREELREEAIENAMDDARQQADTIAAAGDLTATDVLSVEASQHGYDTFSYEPRAVEDSASGSPPTGIEAGDVSVSYSVSVTFDATN